MLHSSATVRQENLIQVEDVLWAVAKETGLPFYDFDFARYFTCRHPWQLPRPVTAVARIGAFDDYERRYRELATEGIELLHSPEEHHRAGDLPRWYPLLEDLTPKSVWFGDVPEAADVAAALGWPVFVKGHRQTSRHRRSLSVVEGPEAFERVMEVFRQDPILRWQTIVCREFLRLRTVDDPMPDRIPSSFEFRTFWWRQQLVGLGRYWWEGKSYEMVEDERKAAIALAKEAARRINVGFLVVDVAQREDGRWIVIECNDGQESGYAGIAPFAMWQRVIKIEGRTEEGRR